jgi:hypothetical protein
MKDELGAAPHGLWRMSLRELFGCVTLLAVGFVCGGEQWSQILIVPATAALMIGLLKESTLIGRALRRRGRIVEQRIASAAIAIGWRAGVCAIIVVHWGIWFLRSQQIGEWTNLDRWGHFSTDYLFLLALVLSYQASWRKWRFVRAEYSRRINWFTWLVAAVVLVVVVANAFVILKLVHDAVAGVEKSHPVWLRRHAAYPDHAAENHKFFWTALAGAVCACVSFVLLAAFVQGRCRTRNSFVPALFILVLCQAFLLAYLHWFHHYEFARLSPDIAGAGFESTPAAWLHAGILLAVGASAIAYSWSVQPRSESQLVVGSGVLWHETMPMLVAMAGAALASCLDVIGAIMEICAQYPQLSFPSLTTVRWIIDPYFLLNVALLMLAISILYRRWRHSVEPPPICVPSFYAGKFATCLGGLLAITMTGVPALSIFGFAVWFSPWTS